jgi:hypothetical protein
MKLQHVSPWIAGVHHAITWNRVISHLGLTTPTTILFEWSGLCFLARKAVVANAIMVLDQRKTAQAKNPLPEPSFTLSDLLLVPPPLDTVLIEELCD